jgi:hypothetical protein
VAEANNNKVDRDTPTEAAEAHATNRLRSEIPQTAGWFWGRSAVAGFEALGDKRVAHLHF